jgi:hypothetical protein
LFKKNTKNKKIEMLFLNNKKDIFYEITLPNYKFETKLLRKLLENESRKQELRKQELRKQEILQGLL